MPFTYILIGFAGGFVGGGLGLGGGAIMVPLLVMVVGLTQHQAQGTVIGLFNGSGFSGGRVSLLYRGKSEA